MENDIFMADQMKNENLVVIIQCYFFEVDQLFDEITDELAFLPICNSLLINILLRRFVAQNFKNILICVKNSDIKKIFEKNIADNIKKSLAIDYVFANDFNEMMRNIDDGDYMYETYILLNVSTLTTLNLKIFLSKYLEAKKIDKNIIMQLLIPKASDKNESLLYGFKNEHEIAFYQNFYTQNELSEYFYAQILENEDTVYKSKLAKPKICVFGKEVLALYNENFDLFSIEDLMEELQHANFYNYKIIKYDYEQKINDFDNLSDTFIIEVNTVKNYYDTNQYFKELAKQNHDNCYITSTKNYNAIIDSFISQNVQIDENTKIKNSFIGKNCIIKGDVENCIVMKDSVVKQSIKNVIVCKERKIVTIPVKNKFFGKVQHNTDKNNKKPTNFFSDVFICLKDNTNDLIANKIEIFDIKKQVNLLTIVWNASNDDLIEAFTLFLIDFVDEKDLDQSTLDITFFFPILYGRTEDEATQSKLVMQINDGLKFKSKRKKSEAMFRISYALIDDGIVTEEVINNSNVVKGSNFK
ncbi:Translation initiation factor eIF-2B subunit epsilon [Binucleata daphniae]